MEKLTTLFSTAIAVVLDLVGWGDTEPAFYLFVYQADYTTWEHELISLLGRWSNDDDTPWWPGDDLAHPALAELGLVPIIIPQEGNIPLIVEIMKAAGIENIPVTQHAVSSSDPSDTELYDRLAEEAKGKMTAEYVYACAVREAQEACGSALCPECGEAVKHGPCLSCGRSL